MSNVNRNTQQTGDQHLIDGLTKHQNFLSSILIGGKSHPVADVIALLQKRIDLAKTAVKSRATWQADVKADHDERASTKAFVAGVKQAVRTAFGNSVDDLADFGLQPHKPHVGLPPEKRVEANKKAVETRKARHTMSKKQRLAIKGGTPATPAPAPVPTNGTSHDGGSSRPQ